VQPQQHWESNYHDRSHLRDPKSGLAARANEKRGTITVKDRALEVLSTLQGNEEEGPMMGEYIGLMNDRGYDMLAN
jgi:hypothetical protein